jgi:6-phosphogluconolactonase
MFRFPTSTQAAEACARRILEILEAAMAGENQAAFAISGGSSPRVMFQIFAKIPFAWNRLQLFWVDERGVPPTDPQSNFKLADDTWLTPANFPPANIHRIPAELAPYVAADLYREDIRQAFMLTGHEMPKFDVIHRGMGPDCHTASLFPGEPLIDDREGLAAAVWVEKFKQWRITLLPGVLLAARHTVMLVTGADKAEALKAALHGPHDPKRYPAQLAARDGCDVAWFVDEPAASGLD